MRKLILRISVSLDGFIETSDGKVDFQKSRSPEGAAWVAERLGQAGAHLMGRKAFSQLATFWPTANNVLAKPMNEIPKIVFTRKGYDPSTASSAKTWADAKVVTGDLSAAIAELKNQPGKDLIAHGGAEFALSLVQSGLVDEFWIAVHPVAAGSGIALFEKLDKALYLKLIETKVFATGAMVLVYRPE